MAGVSGQYGTVKTGTAPGTTVVSEVNHWSFNRSINIFDVASAETPGTDGYSRVKGRRNHTGSMAGLYDPDAPPAIEEGDTVVANFYPSATQYYPCSIMIESFTINDVDIENGSPITWSATFRVVGMIGALTEVTP